MPVMLEVLLAHLMYNNVLSEFTAFMHQSIPAVPFPPPPLANPRALAFFLKWQIPGGGDK